MNARRVLGASLLGTFMVAAACSVVPREEEVTTVAARITNPVTITQRDDNRRSAVNTNEKLLTPARVASAFGKLRESRIVDALASDLTPDGACRSGGGCGGGIYAQPLFAEQMSTVWTVGSAVYGPQLADVLYVVTARNTIAILDANDLSIRLQRTLPEAPYYVGGDKTTAPNGITSTPVIDRDDGRLYLVSRDDKGNFILHVLRTDNLADIASVTIDPVGPTGETLYKEGMKQAPGLLLTQGQVFVALGGNLAGSESDNAFGQYRGWVLGYDATTLAKTTVFCTSPGAIHPQEGAGIWQSGTGLAADEKGIYFMTGNGKVDATHFGDSIVRIPFAGSTFGTVGAFTPSRGGTTEMLLSYDLDLGSSAPLLMGDNLVLGGGKEGVLYLVDRTSMTLLQSFRATYNQFAREYCEPALPSCGNVKPGPGFSSGPPPAQPHGITACCAPDQTFQSHPPTATWYAQITENYPHYHSEPVYWNSTGLVYGWAEHDVLRAFRFDAATQRFTGQPGAASGAGVAGQCGASTVSELFCADTLFANPSDRAGEQGAFLTLSSNGTDAASGVLWALANQVTVGDDPDKNTEAVLHAYAAAPDATGALTELWSSAKNATDHLRPETSPDHLRRDMAHWALPTVRNGRVYVTEGNKFDSRIASYGAVARKDGAVFKCALDASQPDGCARWLTGFGAPDWAASGDFNGDGYTDIAWYNLWKNGSVTIALNDRSGHLVVNWGASSGQWLTGFGMPDWATVGDFNHDGFDDLAWYDAWKDGSITVALNDKNSHFVVSWGVANGQWINGLAKPDWASAGDFNHDGFTDVAWYRAANNGAITIALNDKSGHLIAGAPWLAGFAPPDWAGVGDFNKDGFADVAWYSEKNNRSVTVALNDRAGHFNVNWNFGQTGQWIAGLDKPDWASVGDFDGDGADDLAWYSRARAGSVSVALSDGASRFKDDGPWLTNWGKPDAGFVGHFHGPAGRTDIAWYEQSKSWGIKVGLSTTAASGGLIPFHPWINGGSIVDAGGAPEIHAGRAVVMTGSFSPAGNAVFVLGSDAVLRQAGVLSESTSAIKFALSRETAAGAATVWVEGTQGYASPTQTFSVTAPTIVPFGVRNGVNWRDDDIHRGTTISIFGKNVEPTGNKVEVVDGNGIAYTIKSPSTWWYDSGNQINATLPVGLALGTATVAVVDVWGSRSNTIGVKILP